MLVMIVEDDAINALSLAGELLSAGHRVVGPVWSSDSAVRLARSRHPDLALVDIDLEHKGEGIQVAGLLKQQGIKSVFVTAHAAQARAHQDVAVGVITKPFDPAALPQAINAVQEMLNGGEPPPPPVPTALELFHSN